MRNLIVSRDMYGIATHRNKKLRCIVYEQRTGRREYVIGKFIDRKRWYLVPNYSADEWTLPCIGPFKRLTHAYAAYRVLPCNSPETT